ncbi:MAG: type II toxin-antitoxin system RelE/ParE family toxin [Desulfobacterales bacterium]|nr:type II toxin-antitoxin system RelE/ParE family toxin [Desulfobacterales bacterium]
MAGRTVITFADSAVDDLESILAYYTDQHVPHVGRRLVADIISHIELLKEQPDMGRMVPEFGLAFLRELIRPPFPDCLPQREKPSSCRSHLAKRKIAETSMTGIRIRFLIQPSRHST